jgi:hypothetical protein
VLRRTLRGVGLGVVVAPVGLAFGRTNIYYAAYRAGALRRADGSVISKVANLPIA